MSPAEVDLSVNWLLGVLVPIPNLSAKTVPVTSRPSAVVAILVFPLWNKVVAPPFIALR